MASEETKMRPTTVQIVKGSGENAQGNTDDPLVVDAVILTGSDQIGIVGLSNIADVRINPNTEETQLVVASFLSSIAAKQGDGSQKTQIVDGSGNVIGSLKGALDVHIADVHDVLLNRYMVNEIANTTTLSAGASAEDTSIDIQGADYAAFSVGDWLQLKDGNTQETNFVKITVKPGSPTLTLDRPIDNAYTNGSDVTEVDPNIANGNGSLTVPISYKFQPPANEIWHGLRFILTSIMASDSSIDEFLTLAALTNGVLIRVCNNGVYTTLTNWKKDAEIIEDMFDFDLIDKPPAGKFGRKSRWTLTKAEAYIKLVGSTGDFVELLVQDNLTGGDLESLQIKTQGHLEG